MTENKLIKLDIPADYAAGLPSYRAPMLIQLEQLMSRSWLLAQREPRISRAKIFQTVIVALFLVPTFWQLNKWTDVDTLNTTYEADCPTGVTPSAECDAAAAAF